MIELKCRKQSKIIVILLFFSCLCFMGCGQQRKEDIVWKQEETQVQTDAFSAQTNEQETSTEYVAIQQNIFVHVCGAVANPGLYEIEAGSRVFHAIAAAGGMLSTADQTYINLADLVEDGEQIYVFCTEETADMQKQQDRILASSQEKEQNKININTASRQELTTLTGIGDSRAEAIITYRETKGRFQSIDEIKKVDGIKDGLYTKIKNNITVN